ncbi:TetR/AcrR family transcriptional regulator [Antarcticirhabdus aurantiaca]|uniref:Helix-turn-helix domain containing protein n=1 Tax=Antarcticirhabdus aurantiaca TaxID=2606717 RepID=A0ACD4NI98_9HYPH|nr:TetR/AcrR family transcriptional regulator [Antarcticirhabdus aurantiaca]WAJ26545.1 helix-turn-helix domain containing protein [Jeongeuplla avenae]
MANRVSARERLLTAASGLFYERGISATGIDTVIAQAGVAKMSLYNNFASKAELVEAYVETRTDAWRARLGMRLAAVRTPAERILAVFDSYADYADGRDAVFRGCGLLNAAAELAADDPARMRVAAQKTEVAALFAAQLRDIGALPDDLVEETAEHLSFLLEGAMARAGLEGSGARLASARRIAASLLKRLPAA